LHGFDEHFFAHMEEIDLCWRMQLDGYSLVTVPKSVVYHVGGGTLNKQSPQKTYLNFRNNLIMLTKNLPVSTLIWLIPVRSTLDLLSSIFFIMNGLPKYSLAIHKAHSDYFFKYRKWWKLRKINTTFKPFNQLHGVYMGSIVADHFIKKVKYFSELQKNKFTN
jgi:GT2 family glycosyltransferase